MAAGLFCSLLCSSGSTATRFRTVYEPCRPAYCGRRLHRRRNVLAATTSRRGNRHASAICTSEFYWFSWARSRGAWTGGRCRQPDIPDEADGTRLDEDYRAALLDKLISFAIVIVWRGSRCYGSRRTSV